MTLDSIKKTFYNLVRDAKKGMSLNVYQDEYIYVRFNYMENGILFNDMDEYLGNDDNVDLEYEAEYSNGTAYYLPTLKVNDVDLFFDKS